MVGSIRGGQRFECMKMEEGGAKFEGKALEGGQNLSASPCLPTHNSMSWVQDLHYSVVKMMMRSKPHGRVRC